MRCISSEKGRLPRSFLAIFDDFWGPQGGPKMSKNGKNAFQESIGKKKAKKEATQPVRGRVRRRSRPEGMQDSCSGRFLPWFLTIGLHTPPLPAECGGLSSLTRRPPHSTNLLALIHVKKLIRILAISGRTLAIHGRILPQKMQLRSQKNNATKS